MKPSFAEASAPAAVRIVEYTVLTWPNSTYSMEDLLAKAPDIGKLWKVDDVALRAVRVARHALDTLTDSQRNLEVSLFARDELCWRVPLHTLEWFIPSILVRGGFRLECPASLVELWSSLVFRYEQVKEPVA